MLFNRRQRLIHRILIVEDEPLVAFDNERLLREAGYEVVATVDSFADASTMIADKTIDLVLTDIGLAGDGNGIDVARVAGERGIPVLFVTGGCAEEVKPLAVGCLAKPYTAKILLDALLAIDDHRQGRPVRRIPPQLILHVAA